MDSRADNTMTEREDAAPDDRTVDGGGTTSSRDRDPNLNPHTMIRGQLTSSPRTGSSSPRRRRGYCSCHHHHHPHRRRRLQIPLALLLFLIAVQVQQQHYHNGVGSDDADVGGMAVVRSKMHKNDSIIATPMEEATPNNNNITIVVQLSGELGNHLSKLAAGVGVALELQRSQYNITTAVNLKLRHQPRTTKWIPAVRDLHRCFPHTAAWNASEAQEFDHSKQQSWAEADGINSDEAPTVDAAIRAVAEEVSNRNNNHSLTNTTQAPPPPVLYSNHLTLWDTYTDRYHEQFRQLFRFSEGCCRERPYPHETVFHYRNFAQEMPRKAAALGFAEVSPVDLLEQVLRPSNATHVAIVGRFSSSDAGVSDYVQVLRGAGLSVRWIQNQTTTQDFCFLRATQHHLVGHARSTFFGWAALLSASNTSRITAYSIDSPSQRAWAERFGVDLRTHYDWRHSAELRARVEFPLLVETTATSSNRSNNDTMR